MPTTPSTTTPVTSSRIREAVAWVAPPGESISDDNAEQFEFQVIEVRRRAGAGPNLATLRIELGDLEGFPDVNLQSDPQQGVEELELLEDQDREIEIWQLDENGERDLPLLWGTLLGRTIRYDAQLEAIAATAVLAPWHFGEAIDGQRVWDDRDPDVAIVGGNTIEWGQVIATVDYDLEFNPEVDGIPRGNMGEYDDRTGVDYHLWVDPESTRTDEGAQSAGLFSKDKARDWTVGDAVETLAGVWNADEEFVDNAPTRDDDAEVEELFSDEIKLRNEIVRRGAYLPEALTVVLQRYGFNFTVDQIAENVAGELRIRPKIRYFKRGEGPQKTILLQPRRDVADMTQSNVTDLAADWSLLDVANEVRAQGALIEREITLELARGWPAADDVRVDSDRNDPAWRKWVGNEGGDYNELRVDPDPHPTGDPPDLVEAFDYETIIFKRRVFEDCLTYRDGEEIGYRRPPLVEYSIDAGETWQEVPETVGYRILPTECGVYFTGETPWSELTDAGDDARLRVTATIRGDTRIEHVETADASPIAQTVTLTIDASDRFFDRKVVTDGEFASTLAGGEADERDDATEIEEFAEDLLTRTQAAGISARILLEGILADYEIGDILTDVEGRAISLARTVDAIDPPQYVQVVGVKWNFGAQRTELEVAPYDA